MEFSLPIVSSSPYQWIHSYWFSMLSPNSLQTALTPDSTHSKDNLIFLSENEAQAVPYVIREFIPEST